LIFETYAPFANLDGMVAFQEISCGRLLMGTKTMKRLIDAKDNKQNCHQVLA
jgi:hypothetical protein